MENKILDETQLLFLNEAGKSNFIKDNFYLTGGTALAAFYLGHRYSEDLDFFSEKEVDNLAVDVFIKQIQKILGAGSVDFQQSYNRNMFFLRFKNEVLKTEFTYFPFPRIEEGVLERNIRIDSLLDIAVNKLFTIYQRSLARDYIDLYFIIQKTGHSVRDLIAKAKIKFDWHIDPIQLGTQFVKAKEAIDFPRMITELEPNSWQDFFIAEAKKLKPEIITES